MDWANRHKGYPGGKSRRAGAYLGFSALLPYFFLPIIYFFHLTLSPLPAAYGDPRAGPSEAVSQPQKPHYPFHDSNSCPICRITQTVKDGGFLPSYLGVELPALTGIIAERSRSSGCSCLEVCISRTRAPPISSRPII
jgi:hypothetical protein